MYAAAERKICRRVAGLLVDATLTPQRPPW